MGFPVTHHWRNRGNLLERLFCQNGGPELLDKWIMDEIFCVGCRCTVTHSAPALGSWPLHDCALQLVLR